MNISNIKAFLGERPGGVPHTNVNQQLKDQALAQVAKHKTSQSPAVALSSQFQIGVKVVNNGLSQNLTVNGYKADLAEPKTSGSLFDFKEIAKNVLNFVGGVIKGAHASGADEVKLQSLFEQARAGVQKGIKLAEQDLGELLNDEIKQGIADSRDLIEKGIQRLESELLGKPQQTSSAVSESASLQRSQAGSIHIRTQDGDTVTISFEDTAAFEAKRSLLASSQNQASTPEKATNTLQYQQRYEYFQSNRLSFSVEGELDEKEMEAIASLVKDADELADSFFAGNVETAFKQASSLGFDEKELAGFALQLNRQESVQAISTYERVSHFDKEQGEDREPQKVAKPVAEYIDKMLHVMQQSEQKLENAQSYETLINGLINEMKEVHTPDLISAINRFHDFNHKMLNALPGAETTPEKTKPAS